MAITLDVNYATITERSAREGDYEDCGWEYEDILFDTVYELIDYLLGKGAVYPSASYYHYGLWYSDDGYQDPHSGSTEIMSYHPNGLEEGDSRLLYNSILKGENLADQPEDYDCKRI